jgi:PTS system galactitol-specific IIA component
MTQLVKLLHPSNIHLDMVAKTKEEALLFIAEDMKRQGFVKESYPEAVLQRETVFPTGLQTKVCGVAIPHTDTVHVIQEAVYFATLSKPNMFQMMEFNEQQVEVSMIFMLAMKDSHSQLDMLQELVAIFQHPDRMTQLKQAKTIEEVYDSFQSNEASI